MDRWIENGFFHPKFRYVFFFFQLEIAYFVSFAREIDDEIGNLLRIWKYLRLFRRVIKTFERLFDRLK